ncbi:MAG: nucleotide exchange factor GrpE [Candidatus Moranbacteria bacterium]|nr:nucleotide exchange factor GrpE [Candidatus Moranbacteria bacterium]
MTDEKKIEPACNASHSDAGRGEIKDVKKSIFKKAVKKESKEEESSDASSSAKATADEKALADTYLLGWRRCMADFENYKKRQQENQKSLGEYVKEDFMLQIIPVIDNFHSATEHIPEEQKNVPWVVGIIYIQKQLEDVLKENGVTEMDVKVGDEFDPNLHEAVTDSKLRNVSESTNNNEELENKIKKVVLRGYKLGGKVIRAARVIVE